MFLKASNNYHPHHSFWEMPFLSIQHTRLLQVGSQERLELILQDRVGFDTNKLADKFQHSKSLFAAAYIWIEFYLRNGSVPCQSRANYFFALPILPMKRCSYNKALRSDRVRVELVLLKRKHRFLADELFQEHYHNVLQLHWLHSDQKCFRPGVSGSY